MKKKAKKERGLPKGTKVCAFVCGNILNSIHDDKGILIGYRIKSKKQSVLSIVPKHSVIEESLIK